MDLGSGNLTIPTGCGNRFLFGPWSTCKVTGQRQQSQGILSRRTSGTSDFYMLCSTCFAGLIAHFSLGMWFAFSLGGGNSWKSRWWGRHLSNATLLPILDTGFLKMAFKAFDPGQLAGFVLFHAAVSLSSCQLRSLRHFGASIFWSFAVPLGGWRLTSSSDGFDVLCGVAGSTPGLLCDELFAHLLGMSTFGKSGQWFCPHLSTTEPKTAMVTTLLVDQWGQGAPTTFGSLDSIRLFAKVCLPGFRCCTTILWCFSSLQLGTLFVSPCDVLGSFGNHFLAHWKAQFLHLWEAPQCHHGFASPELGGTSGSQRYPATRDCFVEATLGGLVQICTA